MSTVTIRNPKTGETREISEQEALSRGAKPSANYQVKKALEEAGNKDQYHPLIQKLGGAIDKHPKLAKGINELAESPYVQIPESAARGALQTGGDMFASVANAINKPINKVFGTNFNQKHPDFREGSPEGTYNDLAFGAGQLGAGLAAGGLTRLPGALQALQRVPRPGGKMGLGLDAALGAGTGWLLGEDEEGNRGMATALGGIFGPLASVTNRGITNRVLGDRSRQLTRHGEAYDRVFDAAEEAGVPYISQAFDQLGQTRSQEIFHRLMGRLPIDSREAVTDFIRNPGLNNGHALQSELGTWMRTIEKDKRFKTNTLPTRIQRAYEAARDARRAIQSDISSSLAQGGLVEESMLYPAVTRSYAENVAPYFNEAIGAVVNGEKLPEKLAKRLAKDERFMMEIGERYPEISINKFLTSSVAKKAAILGAGLLGFNKIVKAEEGGDQKMTGNNEKLDLGEINIPYSKKGHK
jgi:hypothetical protein